MIDQFSQHHLLKRLSFLHCIFLPPFVKDKVSTGAWIYLWAFYFVPLIYIPVFVPVPYCLDDCGFVVDPEVRHEFLMSLNICDLHDFEGKEDFEPWLCSLLSVQPYSGT